MGVNRLDADLVFRAPGFGGILPIVDIHFFKRVIAGVSVSC
jgi:hypothetical protein